MQQHTDVQRIDRRNQPAQPKPRRFELMVWDRPDLPGIDLDRLLGQQAAGR